MSETEERQQIISALKSAQGALNPLSGFLRAPRPKVQSHLDAVRDQIRSALDAPRRPLRPRQIGDHGSRRGSGNWRRQKKAGGKTLTHELKFERPNDLVDYRILAHGLNGQCPLSDEDWRRSRRALVSLVRRRRAITSPAMARHASRYSRAWAWG